MNTIDKPDDKRQAERTAISFQASLTLNGQTQECGLLDVSTGGAKLITEMIVNEGDKPILTLGKLGEFNVEVVWIDVGAVGIHFLEDEDRIAKTVMALELFGLG